ncbi:unnamed protein product [Rotaria socialis]
MSTQDFLHSKETFAHKRTIANRRFSHSHTIIAYINCTVSVRVRSTENKTILSAFTDVPPPPKRPERFHSREELKRYLQLV